METMWSGDALDLAAYVQRVGHAGPLEPNAETLCALASAHVAAVPFENLDAVLGREISLDPEAVQRKLVHQQRGGYCYEHVVLFAAVLERLGYSFTAHSARVRLGSERYTPATHALLAVDAGSQRWLVDVGFGAGMLSPMPLRDGERSRQGEWEFRVHREQDGTWVLQRARPEGWFDLHAFPELPQFPVDFRVGNHYIATHPHSPFSQRPMLQRVREDRFSTLFGTTLHVEHPNGTSQDAVLDAAEVPQVAERDFGVRLDEEDAHALAALLRAS